MNKRILSAFLALFTLFSLCSCGSKRGAVSTNNDSTDSNVNVVDEAETTGGLIDIYDEEEDYEEDEEESDFSIDEDTQENDFVDISLANYEITSAREFSEGLAWINYEKDSQEYTGCIDKSGKLMFYYEGDYGISTFEDGYAYLTQSDTVYMVDTKGNVVSSYPVAPGYIISGQEKKSQVSGARVWGGGYVLYQEFGASFDEPSTFIYSVLDKDGNKLHEFTHEDTKTLLELYYLGNGVFAYSFKVGETCLYFAKTDTVVEYQPSYDYMAKVQVQDGYFVYFCGSYMSLSDDQGNVQNIPIPSDFGNDPEVIGISDGYVLLKGNDGHGFYSLYNIETGDYTRYEGKYADNLYWESAVNVSQSYGFTNGVIAISLKGQDNEQYIGLMNTNWEEICEPFLGESFSCADNALVVSDTFGIAYHDVYDLNGNRLCGFSGDPHLGGFSENIMMKGYASIGSIYGETCEYLYHDGSKAITDIDFSSGVLHNIT